MSNEMNGYMAIESELQQRRAQREGVKDKDTPFRVESRYSGGTLHYQYFAAYEDTMSAEDSSCRYSPFGRAIIERPSSRQIQKRGPRGGWAPYNLPINMTESDACQK
jgi:hypothetical protein